MKNLSEYIPGLHISKGAGEWNVYMRGIGSGTNKGFSQSITTFIDGMPITQGSQYTSHLMDVERVEVLRGTQGVLFGKNTIGGVINITNQEKNEADYSMQIMAGPLGYSSPRPCKTTLIIIIVSSSRFE